MDRTSFINMGVDFLKAHPTKLVFVLLALIFVPYFAYQNMKDRKAREADEHSFLLDVKVEGVKLLLQANDVAVLYQDGTKVPADGVGIAAMTWDDYQKTAPRLQQANLKQEDFPVVVFFNISGFDSTGEAQVVRKAKTGVQLWAQSAPPKRLRALVPARNGDFVGYFYQSVTDTAVIKEIREADFYRTYVGIEPPIKLPPQNELDKLSDEQLKQLGLVRTKKEVLADKSPSGIKGKVFRVGLASAVTPFVGLLHVLDGKVEPTTMIDKKIVTTVTTATDGTFSIPLPAGEYTLIVQDADGKLYGNAINQKQWPSTRVTADTWKDYEFRISR